VTGRWQESKQMMSGLRPRMDAFLKPVLGALRVLFLEVTGVVYLCLSLTFVGAFLREYHKFTSHQSSIEHVVLAGVFAAMFVYFGISSLWRARQKRSRSQA
jgi:type VI protein secretion system component VasK